MTILQGAGWRASGIAAGALLIAAGAFAIQAGSAAAAAPQTRYVATTGDDTQNDCLDQQQPCASIQHAVGRADPGDTISIAGGTYHESVFTRISLTFTGAGATGAGRSTIDGGAGDASGPSIEVNGGDAESPPHVFVRDLDVSGNQSGAGVQVEAATATVTDSVVSNNSNGGVVAESPAASSSATVIRTTLHGNTGAGVVATGSADAMVRDSTVSGTVPFPEAERFHYGGGVLALGGAVTIDASTIFGNAGQGVLSQFGQVEIDNSTISGTRQGNDSGLPNAGVGVQNQPTALLRPAARNQPFALAGKPGAGLALRPAADGGPSTTVTGSIVADQDGVLDCAGDGVLDGGYNLSGDAKNSCEFAAEEHDQSRADPKLGGLADNGGPTRTLLPAKGSDAIDAIPTGSAGCNTDVRDQRGVARPQGGNCDIGAVEDAQPPVVISPDALPHGTVGKPYSVTISATGGLGPPYVFSLVAGKLPPGLTFGDDAVISGTPTSAGTYKITVSVDDPVQKDYAIVIEAAAAPPTPTAPAPSSSSGTAPIANTGANVAPLTTFGATAIAAGLLLVVAGAVGRRPGRHRVQ